jgi:hypothetical protein
MVDENELLQEIEEVVEIFKKSPRIDNVTVRLAQNHLERWVKDSNLPTSEGGLKHVLESVGVPKEERTIVIDVLVEKFPDLESDQP